MRHDFGTVAIPAYIVLYRNPRGSNRWYVHRGYTAEIDATNAAEAFKKVDLDTMILPTHSCDEKTLKILNAF